MTATGAAVTTARPSARCFRCMAISPLCFAGSQPARPFAPKPLSFEPLAGCVTRGNLSCCGETSSNIRLRAAVPNCRRPILFAADGGVQFGTIWVQVWINETLMSKIS